MNKEFEVNLKEYYKEIPNIDRACSTVFENSLSIFLPFKRIDKSKIYNEFIKNGKTLEIDNDLIEKIEIRNQLLGQTHKDILEILLTTPKIYNKTTAQFKVKITAYNLTKRLKRNRGKRQWVIEKVKDIAGCRINLYFNNHKKDRVDFNFNFISSIKTTNENEIEITFTPEYTYFLMKNELLDYSRYIDDIMDLENQIKRIQKKIGLKRTINSEFIKAVVRYMLIHKIDNNKVDIEQLIERLKLRSIMSKRELNENLQDLQRKEMQYLLKEKFGISLINQNKTIAFNPIKGKPIHHLKDENNFIKDAFNNLININSNKILATIDENHRPSER